MFTLLVISFYNVVCWCLLSLPNAWLLLMFRLRTFMKLLKYSLSLALFLFIIIEYVTKWKMWRIVENITSAMTMNLKHRYEALNKIKKQEKKVPFSSRFHLLNFKARTHQHYRGTEDIRFHKQN